VKISLSTELTRNNIYKIRAATFFLFLLAAFALNTTARAESSAPAVFSYAELTMLYEQERLSPPLEEKLNKLLTTPFVDNGYTDAAHARFSQSPALGEYLRVAQWNIERGLEYEAIAAVFGSEAEFTALLGADQFPPGSDKRRLALEQAAMLRQADVIILNEVDLGMKRTDYRNTAAELAARLKMNYAFGVQFIELSPVHLSQEKPPPTRRKKNSPKLSKLTRAVKRLARHRHLSRFPLENVRLVPLVINLTTGIKARKTARVF
jgi:hypothetical protein